MENINWGIPIALALFLAGFGAGAFLLAALCEIYGRKQYQMAARIGALIAPLPVILGVLCLVIDLGKPLRFWEMMLMKGSGLLMFNFTSVMSVGVWLLTVFVTLSLLYAVLHLFNYAEKLRKTIGIIGIPFGLLVTVYTGVLLAATANPLWNTILLPALFSVSAMSTGIAGVIFVLAIIHVCEAGGKSEQSISKLEKIDSRVIALELLIVAIFILTMVFVAPVKLIIGSAFGVLLWVIIIGLGLIVPLYFGFKGEAKKPQTALIVSALVLLGGLILRYVIVIGGQV